MRTRALFATIVAVALALGWWTVPAHAGDDGVTAQQQQDQLFVKIQRFHDHHAKHNPHALKFDSILQREATEHSKELAEHDEDDFSDFNSHANDIADDDTSIAQNEICGQVARIGCIPTVVAQRLFDQLRADPDGRACMLDLDGFKSNRMGVSVRFNNSRFYATMILARSH